MADTALQEITFSFAGKEWTVRPEFKKIVAIEGALEQPSRALGLKCLRSEASVGEVAVILFLMLQDEKDAPSRDKVGETIMEDGYDSLLSPIGQYLLRAIRGNKVHEKEAAAKQREPDPSNPKTP